MSWFNLYEHASHSRATHRILVLAQVFLCHSVDVFLCSIKGHFPDAPSDYGHVVRSGRVANVERDFRSPYGVSVL